MTKKWQPRQSPNTTSQEWTRRNGKKHEQNKIKPPKQTAPKINVGYVNSLCQS